MGHDSRCEKGTSSAIRRPFLRGPRSAACVWAGWVGWVGVLLLLVASYIPVAQSATSAPRPYAVPSSLAAVVAHAKPSVVNITAEALGEGYAIVPLFPITGPSGDAPPVERVFHPFVKREILPSVKPNLGSGLIISADGLILTTYQVIEDTQQPIVHLPATKESYWADIMGVDPVSDLALLAIDAGQPLPTVRWGESAGLTVGEWVVAIGYPFGLQESVTVGIVSATGPVFGAGPYDDLIHLDASIHPGSAGGPLLNLRGEVVGIIRTLFDPDGRHSGVGFAIPIDLVKPILTQLEETGTVSRGWLGVTLHSVTLGLAAALDFGEARGVLVAGVNQEGPAGKAGLKPGDIIVSFDGTAVETPKQLATLIAQTPVGHQATLVLVHDRTEQILSITVAEQPEPVARATVRAKRDLKWGLTVTELTEDAVQFMPFDTELTGVLVTEIDPGGPAELGGIEVGDVVEEVNRQPIASVQDFIAAIHTAAHTPSVLLLIHRAAVGTFVVLHEPQ